MKIDFFTLQLKSGALVNTNVKFARKFVERGHSVSFISMEKLGSELPAVIPSDIKIYALETGSHLAALVRISRLMKVRKPDYLFVSGYLTSVVAIIACKLFSMRTRVVTRAHEVTSLYLASRRTTFDRKILKYVMMCLYRFAYRNIAVSRFAAEDLERLLCLGKGEVSVLYDPAGDIEFPGEDVRSPHAWLGDDEVPVIVAIGRLEVEKDFPTALKALAIANRTTPMRLIILGDGSLRKPLQMTVKDLGLAELVSFPGHVSNVKSYLRRADAFLSTSVREGLSNVIIEALASGCPVIATDCPGGPREILADGRFGLLVPVGDASAIAEAIFGILESAERYRQAGSNRAKDFRIDRIWESLDALCPTDSN